MSSKKRGFTYIYTKEKAEEYKKLSPEQRLEWLEKINRFLYHFMSKESKVFCEKLRRGEI